MGEGEGVGGLVNADEITTDEIRTYSAIYAAYLEAFKSIQDPPASDRS